MGWFTKKATDSAIDNVKETLNDKLETYSGIIKIGLTVGVLAFGSKKINQHTEPQTYNQTGCLPGQPVIINNYFGDERRGYSNDDNGNRQIQNHKRHQNRR